MTAPKSSSGGRRRGGVTTTSSAQTSGVSVGPIDSHISKLVHSQYPENKFYSSTMERSGFFTTNEKPVLPVSSSDVGSSSQSSQESIIPREDVTLLSKHQYSWQISISKKFFKLPSLLSATVISLLVVGVIRATIHKHPLHNLVTEYEPIRCHAHNDYEHHRPLFDALQTGCIGVEADIWLRNNDLWVAHTHVEMDPHRTLRSLYIDPLVKLLDLRNLGCSDAINGVYEDFPKQSLVLLIDFKEGGQDVFDEVIRQLEPLRQRGWLTSYDNGKFKERPITAVLTGEVRLEQIMANNTYRDVFLDAPAIALLNDKEFKYNYTNSYYASAKYRSAFGWAGSLFNRAYGIEKYAQAARERGLLLRFWSQPWAILRRKTSVWAMLLDGGAALINVDDFEVVNRFLTSREDGSAGSLYPDLQQEEEEDEED